mmetsp:Transcript_18002/g.20803  ORF Transcript_18002/g.20803 Transcript_18002/m.20803 type:complete len:85 (+) Transcript_18002:100-354(+)
MLLLLLVQFLYYIRILHYQFLQIVPLNILHWSKYSLHRNVLLYFIRYTGLHSGSNRISPLVGILMAYAGDSGGSRGGLTSSLLS